MSQLTHWKAKLYGKLIREQEGFLLGERGKKEIPNTFTNRLPPRRCLPAINGIISIVSLMWINRILPEIHAACWKREGDKSQGKFKGKGSNKVKMSLFPSTNKKKALKKWVDHYHFFLSEAGAITKFKRFEDIHYSRYFLQLRQLQMFLTLLESMDKRRSWQIESE